MGAGLPRDHWSGAVGSIGVACGTAGVGGWAPAGGDVTLAGATCGGGAVVVLAVAVEAAGGVAFGGGLTEEGCVSYGGIGCKRFCGLAVVGVLETQFAACAPSRGVVLAVAFPGFAATGTMGLGLLPSYWLLFE